MNKSKALSVMVAMAIGAQASAEDINYDYVEAGVILADNGPLDGKGPGISASVGLPQLHSNATLVGGASYLDFEGRDNYLLTLEGGAGFHWPLTPVLDLVGTGSLVYQKIDSRFSNDSEIGPQLTAGVRAKPLGPAWEFYGGLKYIDAFYEDTIVEAGALYTFSPGLSAGVKLAKGDVDTVTLSLRWNVR